MLDIHNILSLINNYTDATATLNDRAYSPPSMHTIVIRVDGRAIAEVNTVTRTWTDDGQLRTPLADLGIEFSVGGIADAIAEHVKEMASQ